MENKSLRGAWGEALAAEYLRKKRYAVIACNYRCRFGEIDVIAQNRRYVVFVEVKLRKSGRYGGAAGAAILREAARMAKGRAVTLLGDFVMPEVPRCILLPAAAVTLCGGDKPTEAATAFLKAPLPDFVAYAKAESDNLVARAVGELSACLAVHDEIEAIYRPFVNYDRVNTESDALLARLGL